MSGKVGPNKRRGEPGSLRLELKAKRVYSHMVDRCGNPKDKNFQHYGGRGIEVRVSVEVFSAWYCKEVRKFARKCGKIGKPSVDRIDNDGHYDLKNLQIISTVENVRKSHRDSPNKAARLQKAREAHRVGVMVFGVEYVSISEAARQLGHSPGWVVPRVEKYLGKESQNHRLRNLPGGNKGVGIVVLGKEYRSISEAVRDLGRSHTWVIPRVEKYLGNPSRNKAVKPHWTK